MRSDKMIISILVVLIIIILYIYLIKYNHPNFDVVLYDSIKHKLKSGDLILFSSCDNFNQIPMLSYYTHIGVVYKKDKHSEPVFVESFNPKNKLQFYPKEFSDGMAICNLEERIKTYRGYVFYKELAHPISETANKDFAEFITYAKNNIKYDKNVITNEIHKIILNTPFTNETNCGQFTELILLKLNLLDNSYFKNRRRHHLRTMSLLTNVKNNYYKKPVYIYHRYFISSDYI